MTHIAEVPPKNYYISAIEKLKEEHRTQDQTDLYGSKLDADCSPHSVIIEQEFHKEQVTKMFLGSALDVEERKMATADATLSDSSLDNGRKAGEREDRIGAEFPGYKDQPITKINDVFTLLCEDLDKKSNVGFLSVEEVKATAMVDQDQTQMAKSSRGRKRKRGGSTFARNRATAFKMDDKSGVEENSVSLSEMINEEMKNKSGGEYHVSSELTDSLKQENHPMDGGALWDIFRRQDVPKLKAYLQKHFREFRDIRSEPVGQVTTI